KPDNRDDLGPYVDWAKLMRLADLSEGDCFGLGPPGPEPEKPPVKKAPPSTKKPSPPEPKKENDATPLASPPQPLPPPEVGDAQPEEAGGAARARRRDAAHRARAGGALPARRWRAGQAA